MWRRKKKERPTGEGRSALEQAQKALSESRSEREEVEYLSSFLRLHRVENHWSQRIDRMLREGR